MPAQSPKTDIIEYLSYLSDLGRSGITRARKLASLREFFKYLCDHELLPSSPAASVAIPKKERKTQTYLRPDEYARLLSAAGSNPRDFAILQLFLQTGIRVSELVNLTLADVVLVNKVISVAGKGSTNIKDMMRITENPETEDAEQIPTFCEMEKDFADRRVNVAYSTSYQEQAGKIIKYATVHWVSVNPPLADYFTKDQQQASHDWLEPRTIKHLT